MSVFVLVFKGEEEDVVTLQYKSLHCEFYIYLKQKQGTTNFFSNLYRTILHLWLHFYIWVNRKNIKLYPDKTNRPYDELKINLRLRKTDRHLRDQKESRVVRVITVPMKYIFVERNRDLRRLELSELCL